MSTSEYRATTAVAPTGLPRLRAADAVRRIPVGVWVLGTLVVIAAVIRVLTIDNQSFWADEALTVHEARLPFAAMMHSVTHIETTPPLYFLLVWAVAHVFGTGEVAMRSISTVAGVALVPIAYLAARDLVSRRAGVIAAAFVAVNPFLIWYSQEARAYMLLAALCGASFLWFVRAYQEPSGRNLVWWVVCSVLAITTHFFAGFLIAPEALLLLWASRSLRVFAAIGAVAVAQLAILPLAAVDSTHQAGWISHEPRLHRISTTILEWMISLLLRRASSVEAFVALALVIVAVTLLLFAGADARIRRGAAIAAGIAAFVFVVPLALGFFGQDYFLSRNEIPAFIPVTVAVAAGCAAPRARAVGTALALVLLGTFAAASIYVQTHPSFQRPDWRAVAKSLGPATGPRAILAADGPTASPLQIYLPGAQWSQRPGRRVLLREIDVVGAQKKLPVDAATVGVTGAIPVGHTTGKPLPRSSAPPGMRLLARFRVDNWVIAKLVLVHPVRLSINQLSSMAWEFFRHAPASLLIFTQR